MEGIWLLITAARLWREYGNGRACPRLPLPVVGVRVPGGILLPSLERAAPLTVLPDLIGLLGLIRLILIVAPLLNLSRFHASLVGLALLV